MDPVSVSPQTVTPERIGAQIFAVAVLYRQTPEQSIAWNSLLPLMSLFPGLEVLLWDNTPGIVPHLPEDLSAFYRHDPTNPGLCAAYNAALDHAVLMGRQWLLLLDQDTAVTAEFLQELLDTIPQTPAVAIVPKLVHAGVVVSPFRPRFFGPPQHLPDSTHGLMPEPMQAFNSGALLRISRLLELGGFDRAFPLDYLDHATFAALQANGGRIHITRAQLQHELSTHTDEALTDAALRRQTDTLAGERRFYAKYGTPTQRRLFAVRMLRRIVSVLLHKRDFRHARMMLKTLVSST